MLAIALPSFLILLSYIVPGESAPTTVAATTATTFSTEPSCQRMFEGCLAQSNQAVTNFFSIKSCVFAATCNPTTYKSVDATIQSVYAAKNGNSNTAGYTPSANQAQVPATLLTFPVNKQIWIDAWYNQLSASNGPWPANSTIVTDYFYRVQLWTASCGHSVAYQNFVAYFQSSSSATKSPGCPTIQFPNPPIISSEPSCQKVYQVCLETVRYDVTDFFSIPACVFTAACFGGSRPVNGAVASVYSVKNPTAPSTSTPTAQTLTRVPADIFINPYTNTNATFPIAKQQWIDAWYSFLSSVDGPYPSSPTIVISYFNRILEWTGFCKAPAVIPLQNFADYFQWSSVVNSPACRVA